mmetsp:Transcript_13413/g.37010  ORF Transcript_13413/g.37010 Transcript_13413/m.37010 type:complete len:251 (-) Transcript_13413:15-767(-)
MVNQWVTTTTTTICIRSRVWRVRRFTGAIRPGIMPIAGVVASRRQRRACRGLRRSSRACRRTTGAGTHLSASSNFRSIGVRGKGHRPLASSRWEFPPTRRKRTVSFAADTDASKVTGRTQMRSSSRGSAAGSATPPQTPTRPPLPPGRNNPGDGHDTGPNSPGESPNPPHPATNADGGGGGGNPLIYHVTYPQSSEASNFDKGGRRSSSDYEKFSNKEHWHKWQRSTLGQAYEHKSENILDVTFIPVGGT